MPKKDYEEGEDDIVSDLDEQVDDDEMSASEAGFAKGADEEDEEKEEEEEESEDSDEVK